MSLTVNRSLLNPKFKGYRLSPEDVVATRYKLQYQPTQSTLSGQTPFSYQEMQSRITHNHLAVAMNSGRALYIDSTLKVVLMDLDMDTLEPSFRVICELPRPVSSAAVQSCNYEYPSAAFLTPSNALVTDGHGTMYIVQISDTHPAQITGPFELTMPECGSIPFRIHDVVATPSDPAVAVLSSRSYDTGETGPASAGSQSHKPVQFDLWAVRCPAPVSGAQPLALDVLWRRRGDDIPFYVTFDASRRSHLIIGSSPYREPTIPRPEQYEPVADEMAPIPRHGESLDVMTSVSEKPAPYSWSQTSDTVHVAFPLPSTTSKSDISVSFTPRSLSLQIACESTASLHIPRYAAKELWDAISVSSCFWTWDRHAEHSLGLLTLILDKQKEGRKWMHVFAEVGTQLASETSLENIEVPETLDPSELSNIRQALEKYTSALRDGEDAGMGAGIPSLAEGEMDEEVDSAVGREAFLTWINEDGTIPTWTARKEAPVIVLSTPLHGIDTSGISLIIKTALDGAVFVLEPAGKGLPGAAPGWIHSDTYSALAFVLASKQDARFTHHVCAKAVFAFESGAGQRGGHVWVYRAHRVDENWAKQSVVKVVDPTAGDLLGVGALATSAGQRIIVCLSERELVLIRGFL